MVKRSLLLSYVGLPKSWESYDEDNITSAALLKVEKAAKVLGESTKGGTVFVSGNPSVLFNKMFNGENLQDFKGLNFPEFFSSKMDKDTKSINLIPKKFTFIYGVGNESALNKQFSGQLLKQIISDCQDEGVWCFICSQNSKTAFTKDYNLDILNSITLPNRTETKLL